MAPAPLAKGKSKSMHLLPLVLGILARGAALETPLGRRAGRERRAMQAVVRRRARPTLRRAGLGRRVEAELRPAPHDQLRLRLPLPAAAAARLRGWAPRARTPRRRRRRRRPTASCSPRRGSTFWWRSPCWPARLRIYLFSHRQRGTSGRRARSIAYWCCCLAPALRGAQEPVARRRPRRRPRRVRARGEAAAARTVAVVDR